MEDIYSEAAILTALVNFYLKQENLKFIPHSTDEL